MLPRLGRYNLVTGRRACALALARQTPKPWPSTIFATRYSSSSSEPSPPASSNAADKASPSTADSDTDLDPLFATRLRSVLEESRHKQFLDIYNKYRGVEGAPKISPDGQCVGFMGKRRQVSKKLAFVDVTTPSGDIIQLCSNGDIHPEVHEKFLKLPKYSPVVAQVEVDSPELRHEDEAGTEPSSKQTVFLKDIRALNSVTNNLIVTPEVVFPWKKRHLQIRFHPELQPRLKFRSWLKNILNQGLINKDFTDIETPTLFKSTPEGAREFIVPTRKPGMAYALSQSPQQYKQILMASGISRYMQWARCYRDEDGRTDRQPEFTQLDMEWAFAGPETVRRDVTDIILKALSALRPSQSYQTIRNERVPVIGSDWNSKTPDEGPAAHQFTTMTYAEAIAGHGSDKPDLRIPGRIYPIEDLEPIRQFVSMTTAIEDPLMECFTFSLDCGADEARDFVNKYMSSIHKTFTQSRRTSAHVLVVDTSKPMLGLSSLGFEAENIVEKITEGRGVKSGDLVVFMGREKPKGLSCGDGTKIGLLRRMLWRALVDAELMQEPVLGEPGSLQFAWVTEFPMFKPVEVDEPGQGGSAGIAAAHHPFTAPLSAKDFELLFSDPMEAKSAAYDLVLNGVEVGGGSERNHNADIQDFIMREVLKMPKKRIDEFVHLLEALRSGCPPHAGFALGFDRLVALMSGTSTVRDVIAFPKTMQGEDVFVGSPSKLRDEQLETYGLQLQPRKKKPEAT